MTGWMWFSVDGRWGFIACVAIMAGAILAFLVYSGLKDIADNVNRDLDDFLDPLDDDLDHAYLQEQRAKHEQRSPQADDSTCCPSRDEEASGESVG